MAQISKNYLLITRTKARERLRASGKLSYGTVHEKAYRVGVPGSLRASGATAAANTGCQTAFERLCQRWKKLSASKSIGLYPFLFDVVKLHSAYTGPLCNTVMKSSQPSAATHQC